MSNLKFSYSGNPSSSQKDEVRFLIGDTDADRPMLADSEILYLISKYGSAVNASIQAALALVAKFSRMADESVGSVSKSYSQLSEQFRKLSNDLQKKQSIDSCMPYAGGISISDKISNETDLNRVDNFFYRDLHNESPHSVSSITSGDE